jgi:hypothetical protein
MKAANHLQSIKTEQGHSSANISIDAYWREVARQIELRFAMGHPGSWSKPTIDAFLEDFSEKLLQKCLADEQVAARCGVHTVKGELASRPGLSYFSFRRIFIKHESSGNQSSREMFAIYLGYTSVTDLMQKSGLGVEPTPEPVIATATPTSPKKKALVKGPHQAACHPGCRFAGRIDRSFHFTGFGWNNFLFGVRRRNGRFRAR